PGECGRSPGRSRHSSAPARCPTRAECVVAPRMLRQRGARADATAQRPSGAGNAEPGHPKHRDTGEEQHREGRSKVMEDGAHEKVRVGRNSGCHARFSDLKHFISFSFFIFFYGTIESDENTWQV